MLGLNLVSPSLLCFLF